MMKSNNLVLSEAVFQMDVVWIWEFIFDWQIVMKMYGLRSVRLRFTWVWSLWSQHCVINTTAHLNEELISMCVWKSVHQQSGTVTLNFNVNLSQVCSSISLRLHKTVFLLLCITDDVNEPITTASLEQ